jgi:DNA (cytosine-5)-methyltransferase 1
MRRTDATGPRDRKLACLRTGAVPRVLELASGSGGFALGLRSAGFELSAHVEIDEVAAETYRVNFRPDVDAASPWSVARDMTTVSAADVVQDIGLRVPVAEAFDVLVAGLPCQAFARIGRSKLREVTGDDDAFRNDERAGLYRRFLAYVDETMPLAVIIENVPDILNFGGHNVPEEICGTLKSMGYTAAYTILNAAHYGVPQIRERLFLVAYADELEIEPRFPSPTRHLDLPRGYEGSRKVALKHVPEDSAWFRPLKEPFRELPSAVSARDAIGDLPTIREHETTPDIIRHRLLSDRLSYFLPEAMTPYQVQMRTWLGFETSGETSGHLVRLNRRDYATFRSMPHAADYPIALGVAEERFAKAVSKARLAGGEPSPDTVAELRKAIVPPYDPGKFPNKWWKLHPDRPSRTLTAHMGKDTYSHIHYDSDQARTISVREAARLQSFPDGFEFAGAMNAAFRQIGNAVPPLLALAVAREIKAQLIEAAHSEAPARVA